MLELINVSKGYGTPGTNSFRPVLRDLGWQVGSGVSVGIVGPSGSGKTTLLNLLGALDRPDSGRILYQGTDISSFTNDQLALFRQKSLGFVFQQHHLLPQLNLWENVLLPLLPTGKSDDRESKAWAEHLLKKTGIWGQRSQLPSRMSGGECQRAAVVRAMMNKPALLLADEPTGALDEENASILSDLLLRLSTEEGVTLITVTHSAGLASRMEKVWYLNHGSLWENVP